MANFDWHSERSDLSGIVLLDRAPESEGIDLKGVRAYRLGRVRAEMAKRDIAAVILSDPINIRYATGTRNMQVFSMRNAPSQQQRTLYKVAMEQVHHNMDIIKAGMSFRDYAVQAWDIPEKYYANRYNLCAHGCGMTGEYPYLYHSGDFPDAGYDGVIEAGMTICVESYIGEENGSEGVKLEQQLLVTETDTELLSQFPFEEVLIG